MAELILTPVLDINIHETSYVDATEHILSWAQEGESRAVYATNVHVLMEAWDSPDFKNKIKSADLVTPDGMPLVWLMRLKGQRDQERVYGPTLMLHVLEAAAWQGIPVGFYGGAPEVLSLLVQRMQTRFKGLKIMFAVSPPFREMDTFEDEHIVQEINCSGARILFVGLGCPKQEIWVDSHRGRVNAVMLGVGAAFDFHAGVQPQAPVWMQKTGLEWLFRLVSEPRRLWKRYLLHNPRFIALAVADLLGLMKKAD